MQTLIKIERKYIFSFLKNVFTYSTVLYDCIGYVQLLKWIFSFYTTLKIDFMIDILDFLYHTIDDDETNFYIKDILKKLVFDN